MSRSPRARAPAVRPAGRRPPAGRPVKTHVSRLRAKLGARDRAQLVVVAYETGVVSPGRPGHGTA